MLQQPALETPSGTCDSQIVAGRRVLAIRLLQESTCCCAATPCGSAAPCCVVWLLLGWSALTCTRPISQWGLHRLQCCKEAGTCCATEVRRPLAGTTMETFAWGSFVPKHLGHLQVRCVVMGDSRCLKLKAKGGAEGDEMSKDCSPR